MALHGHHARKQEIGGSRMIRYVYIGGQIIEGETEFAYYDTISDRFVTLNGDQVWDSWEDLEETLKYCDPQFANRIRAITPKNIP